MTIQPEGMLVHDLRRLLGQDNLFFLENLCSIVVCIYDLAVSFFLGVLGMASVRLDEFLDGIIMLGDDLEALLQLPILLGDFVLHKGDLVGHVRGAICPLVQHEGGILVLDERHIGVEGTPGSQAPRIPIDGEVVSGHAC